MQRLVRAAGAALVPESGGVLRFERELAAAARPAADGVAQAASSRSRATR